MSKKHVTEDLLRVGGMSIDAPSSTDSNLARLPFMMPGMPAPNYGYLCDCHGSLSDKGAGAYFCGVYVVSREGQNQVITDQTCLGSSFFAPVSATFNGAALPWTLPPSAGLQASFNNGGMNTIKALAIVYLPTAQVLMPYPSDQFNYRAVSTTTTSCPPGIMASVAKSAATFSVTSPRDVHPAERDEAWLLYRGLSASTFGGGDRLMLNGSPLSARRLAVAATHVEWTRGVTTTRTILRASGDMISAGATSWLPGAPASCLILAQPDSANTLRTVLTSQCRQSPDYVETNPSLPITAQVNFDLADALSRQGTFDLWVKVID